MNRFLGRLAVLGILVAAAAAAGSAVTLVSTGPRITAAARLYADQLTDAQRPIAVLPFDTPERSGWHFIPKSQRKGLQVKEMSAAQRQAALALLRAALSETGYDKATKIMSLEALLQSLEASRAGGAIRDPERYYFTLFGEPGDAQPWGLSVEGHHLSLNFAVRDGRVVATTPAFYGANPSLVRQEVSGAPPKGTRVLAAEEELAFRLLATLDDSQRSKVVQTDVAPREIRAAGEARAPAYAETGLAFGEMNEAQQNLLRELVGVYANNLPRDLADARLQAIQQAGYEQLYFAWAGASQPGMGHSYTIQGPTFVIEFVNTQPDASGNPASHIHSVWRDPRGDFGS